MKEKDLKQKRKEFLDDTVKYYSEDTSRRSVLDKCMYRTGDGRKCAIGRYIPDDKYTTLIEGKNVISKLVYNLIPQNISMLGIDFLLSIQSLHDESDNWDKNGLTEKGKEYVNFIEEKYC